MDHNSELTQTLMDMNTAMLRMSASLDRIEERLDGMDGQLEDIIREARRPWSPKWAA
jgi:hypothetical protein